MSEALEHLTYPPKWIKCSHYRISSIGGVHTNSTLEHVCHMDGFERKIRKIE